MYILYIHTLDCGIWHMNEKIQIILDICLENKGKRNIIIVSDVSLIFQYIFWVFTSDF